VIYQYGDLTVNSGKDPQGGQRFFLSQPEPEKSLRTGEISFGREQLGREFDQSPVSVHEQLHCRQPVLNTGFETGTSQLKM
jgi:hypothetical protein